MAALTEDEVRALLMAKAITEVEQPLMRDSVLLTAWQVKNIRAKAKVTQSRMALLLGVTLRTYQRWEAGMITKAGSMAMRMVEEQIPY